MSARSMKWQRSSSKLHAQLQFSALARLKGCASGGMRPSVSPKFWKNKRFRGVYKCAWRWGRRPSRRIALGSFRMRDSLIPLSKSDLRQIEQPVRDCVHRLHLHWAAKGTKKFS